MCHYIFNQIYLYFGIFCPFTDMNILVHRCLSIKKYKTGGASRWQKSKTQRSLSSPQIHQKYIYMWNNSYRIPIEHWQKTSDLPKGKKLPTYLGRAKKKRKKWRQRIGNIIYFTETTDSKISHRNALSDTPRSNVLPAIWASFGPV